MEDRDILNELKKIDANAYRHIVGLIKAILAKGK
jgi:hypothetical protein